MLPAAVLILLVVAMPAWAQPRQPNLLLQNQQRQEKYDRQQEMRDIQKQLQEQERIQRELEQPLPEPTHSAAEPDLAAPRR